MTVSILLDVILVLALLYSAYVGYKNGFLKTVVKFVGYLVAFLASFVGSKLAASLFCGWGREYFLAFSEKHLGDAQNLAPAQAVEKIYESMPNFLSNVANFFFGSPQKLTENIGTTTEGVAAGITDHVVLPIVQILLQVLLFLVLFAICHFLVRRVVKVSGMVRHIPLIGPVNALFGGVLGLLEGILMVIILIWLLSFAVAVTGGSESWFPAEMVEKTYLFRHFYEKVPTLFIGKI